MAVQIQIRHPHDDTANVSITPRPMLSSHDSLIGNDFHAAYILVHEGVNHITANQIDLALEKGA